MNVTIDDLLRKIGLLTMEADSLRTMNANLAAERDAAAEAAKAADVEVSRLTLDSKPT